MVAVLKYEERNEERSEVGSVRRSAWSSPPVPFHCKGDSGFKSLVKVGQVEMWAHKREAFSTRFEMFQGVFSGESACAVLD